MSRKTEAARMLAFEDGEDTNGDDFVQEAPAKMRTTVAYLTGKQHATKLLYTQYKLEDLCKVFNSSTPPEIKLGMKRLDGEYQVRFNYSFDGDEPVQEGFASIEELLLHLLNSKKKKPHRKNQ